MSNLGFVAQTPLLRRWPARLFEWIRQAWRHDSALAWVVAAAAVEPLLWFNLVPAVDLPSHLAIAEVLARLMGDGSAFYELNPQPIPYHLAYAILTPLVAWFGPLAAARLFEAGVLVATVMSVELLRRATGRPRWMVLPVLVFVHDTNLYWGWVASQVATPIIIAGIACLLSGRTRWAAVCALLVGASHIVMVVPWLAWTGAYALTHRPRQRVAVAVGLLVLVPVLPSLFLQTQVVGSVLQRFRPKTAVHYAVYQMRIFDDGLGRACKWAALLLILAAVLWGVVRSKQWLKNNRFALAAFGMALLAYLAVPLDAGSAGWGLNIRYLIFAAVALLLMLPASLPRLWYAALTVALVGYLVATFRFWAVFESSASAAVQLARAAPPGRAMRVVDPKRKIEGAWAPVELNLHGYYLAFEGGYNEAVFAGAHIPIRARKPRPRPQLLWLGDPAASPPKDAVLLEERGRWRLWELASASGSRRTRNVSQSTKAASDSPE